MALGSSLTPSLTMWSKSILPASPHLSEQLSLGGREDENDTNGMLMVDQAVFWALFICYSMECGLLWSWEVLPRPREGHSLLKVTELQDG